MKTLNTLRYYFKSFLLWELLLGLQVTGRYLFAKKSQCNSQKSEPRFRPAFAVCTLYADTRMARNAALLANFAKLYVRHLPLPLSPRSDPMVRVVLPAMKLICLSVFIVGSVKNPAL